MSIDYIIILTALSLYTLLNLYLLRKVSKVESGLDRKVSLDQHLLYSYDVDRVNRIINTSPTLKSEYANRKLKEAQDLISKLGDK